MPRTTSNKSPAITSDARTPKRQRPKLQATPDVQHLGGALAQIPEGNTLEDQIYKAVFDSVMARRLTPGTKLPEPGLCKLFNASRSTVRQVLQRLAHDHIVDLHHNRGAIIAMPSPEETRQIFEARRELETCLIRLAAERITPEQVEQLRTQLAQEHDAMHRFDQPSWARLASGFHLAIAKISGNALLQRYLCEIVSRCSLIVALHEIPGSAGCEHHEHTQIVELLAQGDGKRAAALMLEHLHGLEHRIELNTKKSEPSLKDLLGL